MSPRPGSKIEPTTCPLCDFSSKMITIIDRHVIEAHGMNSQEAWNEKNGGPVRCACGCGSTTTWINVKTGYSKMIRGHNANIYAVYDKETAEKIAVTRGKNWRGMPSWSKGLTKETDERVKIGRAHV